MQIKSQRQRQMHGINVIDELTERVNESAEWVVYCGHTATPQQQTKATIPSIFPARPSARGRHAKLTLCLSFNSIARQVDYLLWVFFSFDRIGLEAAVGELVFRLYDFLLFPMVWCDCFRNVCVPFVDSKRRLMISFRLAIGFLFYPV